MHRSWSPAQWLQTIAILLGLLGLPLVAGGAAARDGGDTMLRIQQRYYPDSFDPQQSAGVEFAVVLGTNYEGLTRLDQHLDVVPAAAASWEYSDDGLTITFQLREGLTYSDGSPLTAERFVDAARRTCDPTVRGDYQHILFVVAGCQEFAALATPSDGGTAPQPDAAAYEAAQANVGVRARDKRTLEVRLTHPAPYFPAIAGMPVFYPAKQELIARGGESWSLRPEFQVGNGPFQITHMAPEQRIAFEANDRYWGGRPAVDTLEYVFMADSAAALDAYRAGDLDMVSLDPSMLRTVESDAQLSQELVRVPGAATSFLSFNLTREPFTDTQVREAFAYAFDRETYCARLRDGGCVPALSWIPPGLPGAIATDAYAFDPDRARQALADSSYGGPAQLPEITFVYWGEDPLVAERAEWIASQYRDILGVAVTLQPLDGKALVAAASDSATYPQLMTDGWIQDYPDPQNWLSVYWTCGTGFAAAFGYCNPDLDALLARADGEPDPAERLALYEAAGHLLVDDVPGVFLSHGVFFYLVKPEVTGYSPTAGDGAWPGQTASLLTVTVAS